MHTGTEGVAAVLSRKYYLLHVNKWKLLCNVYTSKVKEATNKVNYIRFIGADILIPSPLAIGG